MKMKSGVKFYLGVLIAMSTCLVHAQIGNPAPDFTVTDTHGNTHTLYEYLADGKVVVLDFYYTTCGPCQFYSPQVNLAHEKYGCNTADVIFIGIDYNDTNAEVMAYDEEYQIEYPSVSGLDGGGNAVVNQYQIIGFPTFYVIDSSQTIVEEIDPPTLQVFDFRFHNLGIEPASCVTATQDVVRNASLRLFPNPIRAGEPMYIDILPQLSQEFQYEILDAAGRICQRGKSEQDFSGKEEIQLQSLSRGLYIFKPFPAFPAQGAAIKFMVY